MYRNIALLILSAVVVISCLDDNDSPNQNLQEILAEQPQLSIFEEGLQRAGLYTNLDAIIITMFAPSNQAFQTFFTQNGYSGINDIPVDTLSDLLNYHIISGIGTTEEAQSNYYASSNTNSPANFNVRILVENTGSGFLLNNTANTIVEDIEAVNGAIHIIDQVLTPPTVRDLLNQNTSLSVIRNAFDELNILDSIDNGFVHTLFTPVNGAIEVYTKRRRLTGLEDLPDSVYQRLIKSHALVGNRDLEGLVQEQNVLTIDEGTIMSFEESVVSSGTASGLFIVVNDSSVIRFGNVQATDGLLHLVSDVIPIKLQ